MNPKYNLLREYRQGLWFLQLQFILIHNNKKIQGQTNPILIDRPSDLRVAILQLKQIIIESVL